MQDHVAKTQPAHRRDTVGVRKSPHRLRYLGVDRRNDGGAEEGMAAEPGLNRIYRTENETVFELEN